MSTSPTCESSRISQSIEDWRTVAALRIADLPSGEVGPRLDHDHPSWEILAPWDDPHASREHGRAESGKCRTDYAGEPIIEWPRCDGPRAMERAVVTGLSTWREYALECRMRPLQENGGINHDDPASPVARPGLVFRMATVRCYYLFCIEGMRRLVLYRRRDDEWTVLAEQEIDLPTNPAPLTLRVTLDADGIRAECRELNAAFFVTDHTFPSGMAGFRAKGHCQLFSLRVLMTPGQEALNQRLTDQHAACLSRLAAAVPDPVAAGEIRLEAGRQLLRCGNFHHPERNDLLMASPEGLTAETFDGQALWHLAEPLSEPYVVEWGRDPARPGGRLLYVLSGHRRRPGDHGKPDWCSADALADELITVNGATGRIESRVKLPASPVEDQLRHYDLSDGTGRLEGGQKEYVVLREWRGNMGGAGLCLWAFDANLDTLWEKELRLPYGHHHAVRFCDVDGDGRDEMLAGGTLLTAAGNVIWEHDHGGEILAQSSEHYDAVCIGCLADDPERDPVAFLVGGNPGVYVVDALTGRTRCAHRIGHAQWLTRGKLREDLPGEQIVVGTRHGNHGILTLFSGRGDRLWSIQPDFRGEGSRPVQWVPTKPQLLWVNSSARGMGLYDGHGRLVNPLARIRAIDDRFRAQPDRPSRPPLVLRRNPDGPDLLGIRTDATTLRLFAAG